MTIRGIAFDVDGTLYDYHDRKIHESTIEAIRQAHEKGIIIIIATARSYAELNTICQQELQLFLKLIIILALVVTAFSTADRVQYIQNILA